VCQSFRNDSRAILWSLPQLSKVWSCSNVSFKNLSSPCLKLNLANSTPSCGELNFPSNILNSSFFVELQEIVNKVIHQDVIAFEMQKEGLDLNKVKGGHLKMMSLSIHTDFHGRPLA